VPRAEGSRESRWDLLWLPTLPVRMRPDPFAQHVEPGKHAHGSGGSRRRPERLVLPVQQTSLLVPSSGLLLCPDPEAIRRPQVAAALEEEHVFDADSAAAGLPLFDVPEAGTASDGSRVMIAPQRGSARMPVTPRAGLPDALPVRPATRQQQGGRRSRARTCSQMKGGLSEWVRSLPARPRSPRLVKT
jgi:hypothetical protein